MSLGHVIGACKRARVPEHILEQCKPADRPIVENILTVLQDAMPLMNVCKSAMTVNAKVYEITIPCTSNEIFLHQAQTVQNYSPARIADVRFSSRDSVLHMTIYIADETNLTTYSEVSVLRICKRTRYN